MNILMVTNTFTPHVGGVARSVQSFSDAFRRRGHRVMVIAPRFDDMPAAESDVIRFPAIRHFHHSDFSLPVPAPVHLHAGLRNFGAHIVHSHHPFLLGDTALRIAARYRLPIVFTHHTMYERYTHFLPVDAPGIRRFAVHLASGYCNLCDAVVAPGATVAEALRQRGVTVPIEVIPTGIDPAPFGQANGHAFRRRMGIPEQAFLVGYLGRLSAEKNLDFLARAVSRFLARNRQAHFLLVGEGPEKSNLTDIFAASGQRQRLHMAGLLDRPAVAAAYRAMDVFTFASQSETQGMVLAEAMTAGTPVIAVEAPGVRDIVRNGHNGRLLAGENLDLFVSALQWLADRPAGERQRLREGALATAACYGMERSADRMLRLYAKLIANRQHVLRDRQRWSVMRNRIEEEWKILHNIVRALGSAARPAAQLQMRSSRH
jgi:glycosyltransferase involved in cell wall biosynthesis